MFNETNDSLYTINSEGPMFWQISSQLLWCFIFSVGVPCIVAGWGRANQTSIVDPRKLKELPGLKIYDKEACAKVYGFDILSMNAAICAGVPGKQFQAACYVKLSYFYWIGILF